MSISAVGGWLKRSMPTVLAVTALAVASDKPNSTAMLAGIVAAVLAVRWAREQGIADEARRGHTLLCRLRERRNYLAKFGYRRKAKEEKGTLL